MILVSAEEDAWNLRGRDRLLRQHQKGLVESERELDRFALRGISTANAMWNAEPQITKARRCHFGDSRDLILRWVRCERECANFASVERRQTQITWASVQPSHGTTATSRIFSAMAPFNRRCPSITSPSDLARIGTANPTRGCSRRSDRRLYAYLARVAFVRLLPTNQYSRRSVCPSEEVAGPSARWRPRPISRERAFLMHDYRACQTSVTHCANRS
jgi:hypothetical protein